MPEQNNPETEMLREQIGRERAFQWRRGIFTMILGVAEIFLCLWGSIALWSKGFAWVGVILLCVNVFFVYQIRMGVKLYRWGSSPIANDEIVQRRQEERMYLFQAAHGKLPSEWRLPSLVTMTVFGLLIIAFCVWDIMQNGLLEGPIIVATLGLLLFGYTLVQWGQARRFKRESGSTLAERLRAGEDTEGGEELNIGQHPESS